MLLHCLAGRKLLIACIGGARSGDLNVVTCDTAMSQTLQGGGGKVLKKTQAEVLHCAFPFSESAWRPYKGRQILQTEGSPPSKISLPILLYCGNK